ncbi:MAG: chorismate mutase [Bryobacteraceae bacterium]
MRSLLLFCSALCLFAQPSADLTQALNSSRQRINSIDDQIVNLLNRRAQVVREVGLIKKQFHAPASAPGREEQVLRRVASEAQTPLTPSAVEAIYKTILHEMSAMEATEMDKGSKPQ